MVLFSRPGVARTAALSLATSPAHAGAVTDVPAGKPGIPVPAWLGPGASESGGGGGVFSLHADFKFAVYAVIASFIQMRKTVWR